MSETSNIVGPLARDGSTIYELMHHGWNHGVEVFRNRWWITVQVDSTISNETSLTIARDIQNALESHADMLAALEEVQKSMKRENLGSCGFVSDEYLCKMIDAAIKKAKGETK